MSQPHLFISPHRDDACFSLASTISLLGGGHLVNIFSRSKYTSHPSLANENSPLSAEVVSAIRKREDQVFAETNNLKAHDLDFSDADLHGLPWNFAADQEFLVEAIESARLICESLTPLLRKLSAGFCKEIATIYCPMAIGGHRDHLSTLLAARMIRSTPWGQEQHWLFYEDLPYASWAWARKEGIERFQAIMEDTHFHKYRLTLTPEQLEAKAKQVCFYASQHPTIPVINNYFCHDSHIHGPHEGIWEETRNGPSQASLNPI